MMSTRREVIERGGYRTYVLHFAGEGAVTYEAIGSGPYATVNYHWLTPVGCSTSNGEPCEYLDGEPCFFDGSGLAPRPEDDEGIWILLAARAPVRVAS